MKYVFRGWVPTVTGRLSFSEFGRTTFPSPAIFANAADQRLRYIVCYQARDTADFTLPFRSFLGPQLLNMVGRMWFVCIARSEPHEGREQEKLAGHLFIFHAKSGWRTQSEPAVRTAQNLLRYCRFGTDRGIEMTFQPHYEYLAKSLSAAASFHAEFDLRRTGTLELRFDDEAPRSETAPDLPYDGRERAHIVHIVAAQLFFFLRDIGHRHQHHDPTTDTVVDLHRITDDDHDLDWRLSTLYSLYRKIIAYKRNVDSGLFHASLGILAYAQTFSRVCHKELDETLHRKLPEFYSESLEKSIQAGLAEILQEKFESQQRSDTVRNLILGTLGLLLSFLGVLQLTQTNILKDTFREPDEYFLGLARFFLTDPWSGFSIIILGVIASCMMLGVIRPQTWRFTKIVVRLFQHVNRKQLSFGWVVAALVCVFLYVVIYLSH